MIKHGTMRFMGKTLHHNPHTIEVTNTANITQQQVPFFTSIVLNTGYNATVIKGEGVFYGENAFEQYLQLKQLYTQGKCGVLSLSGVNPMHAYLQQLKLKCTPVDNYVEYTFMFVEAIEAVNKENSTAPQFYTVEENEDLWSIAVKLNITIDNLVDLNPQLKSPYDITKGDKVRIIDF